MTAEIFETEPASIFDSTISSIRTADGLELPRFITLTVLAHPDVQRVGDRVTLPQFTSGRAVELSRLVPEFSSPAGGRQGPLVDKHLSRRGVILEPATAAEGLLIRRGEARTELEVNGTDVAHEFLVTLQQLEAGVTLVLAQRVALLLHFFALELRVDTPSFGLVGESSELALLKQEIGKVAPYAVPVLIQGETGTGKELVAQAIHKTGPRARRPLVSVNMGALPPTLAAAELFGSVRGGFTGAEKRIGLFERANGGTLFLDEIGETPDEAQVMLLRALETMEIHPVGAPQSKKVDVRVIAATDAALATDIQAGRFREPLLHRLAGYEIQVPSLRERRDDFGRLLFHFLQEELDKVGQGHRLQPVAAQELPWLPAPLVARLARYDWPGNVRQVRNAARRLVVSGLGVSGLEGTIADLERVVAQIIQEPDSSHPQPDRTSSRGRTPSPRRAPKSYRAPHEVTDEELTSVLKAQRWNLKQAAQELGISRASLYVLIDRCPTLRRASDLDSEELRECHQRHQGDLTAMADELEVSRSGLQHRLRQLDKEPSA